MFPINKQKITILFIFLQIAVFEQLHDAGVGTLFTYRVFVTKRWLTGKFSSVASSFLLVRWQWQKMCKIWPIILATAAEASSSLWLLGCPPTTTTEIHTIPLFYGSCHPNFRGSFYIFGCFYDNVDLICFLISAFFHLLFLWKKLFERVLKMCSVHSNAYFFAYWPKFTYRLKW